MIIKLTIVPILFICLALSCTKEIIEENPRIYSYFEANLHQDMDYNAMVSKFGEPDKDIGSGIHIYVYILKDSTEIWIGYADHIYYAQHVDKDHNVLHILI